MGDCGVISATGGASSVPASGVVSLGSLLKERLHAVRSWCQEKGSVQGQAPGGECPSWQGGAKEGWPLSHSSGGCQAGSTEKGRAGLPVEVMPGANCGDEG